MKFSSLFVFASIVVSSFATTPAEVEAGISEVSTSVNRFDNAITNGASLGNGLREAFQGAVDDLFESLEKGRIDANEIDDQPVNEADGREIVDRLQSLRSDIVRTLGDLVTNKVNIQPQLNPTALGEDLSALKAGFNDFVDALTGVVIDNLQVETTESRDEINKAFNDATDAYSSA